MSFFAGLAGGYNTALTQDRQLQAQKDEARATRENAALQHLVSSDDPEIASMAMTGLLQQGRKPSKGLRGFFNETEGNPMLPTIRQLMAQGKQVPNQGAPTPNEPPQGEVPASLAEGGAALPAGSPTEPGSKPMTPAMGAPPGPVAFHEGPSTGTHTVPRQAFLTPMERLRQTEEMKVSAPLTALSKYLTPEQMHTAALGKAGVHIPMTGQFMGNTQEGGQWFRQERFFNGGTGQWELTKIPIAAPTSMQVKPRYETLADATGRPHAYRIDPDGTKTDLGEKAVRDGYIEGIDTQTGEHYSIPAPAVFERPRAGGALSPPPAPVATAGPAPAVAAPPPGAGSVVAPPAAKGPHAAVPPPAAGAPPAAKGGAPRGAIGRGRAKALQQTEGAFLGPDGQPQVGTALFDKATGKYFDPTNPQQELAGFIPGKESGSIVSMLAQSRSTVDLIDKALAALEPYKNDNTTRGALTLASKYRQGVYDPVSTAASATADLAGLQASNTAQLNQGASRSMRYFVAKRQHVPRIPTGRQTMAGAALPAGLVQGASVALEGDEGGIDAPQMQYQKLQLAKQNIVKFQQEVVQGYGKVPERATTGGVTGAPIKMRAPDGRSLSVPPSEVDRLKALGAIVVQ